MIVAILFFVGVSGVLNAQEPENDAEKAISIFNEAQDAHEKGDFASAIKLYGRALEILPEFPEAELQLGNALLSMGRIEDAEKAFRHAVELREDWTLALANHGTVLVRKGAFEEAEKTLARAIELDNQNFPAYVSLVELRLRTNSPPEVLRLLLSDISALTGKANPTASIWAARAALEKKLGDRRTAKISAKKAFGIDPTNLAALSELADIAFFENDLTSAEEFTAKIEAMVPASAVAKLFRARIHLAKGNPLTALEVLNSSKTNTPAIIDLRNDLIAAVSESTTELEAQLAERPDNIIILGRLCSLFRTRDPNKALNYCRSAAEKDPYNIIHAIGFGAALVQAKKYDDAILVLRKLQTTEPDNATIRANLATALFQSKRYAEAKTEFRRLTEMQPDISAAYFFLAVSHDQLSEYADAMANYQHFLKIADPEKFKDEIDRVNLRLPILQGQIRSGKGKKSGNE